MDPCMLHLGGTLLPKCDTDPCSLECCAALELPDTGACSDAWERTLRIHAERARAACPCAAPRSCPFGGEARSPCTSSACAGLMREGSLDPECQIVVSEHCRRTPGPTCAWFVESLQRCPLSGNWTSCATLKDPRGSLVEEALWAYGVATQKGHAYIHREAYDWVRPLQGFGCTRHGNLKGFVRCPPSVAFPVISDWLEITVRAGLFEIWSPPDLTFVNFLAPLALVCAVLLFAFIDMHSHSRYRACAKRCARSLPPHLHF